MGIQCKLITRGAKLSETIVRNEVAQALTIIPPLTEFYVVTTATDEPALDLLAITLGLQWSFREPIAALMVDGKTIGRHYAGRHWALDQGKVAATAPGATSADVPLLKVSVIDNEGLGALGLATLVYRMNTSGGPLAGACSTDGTLRGVACCANYVFVK